MLGDDRVKHGSSTLPGSTNFNQNPYFKQNTDFLFIFISMKSSKIKEIITESVLKYLNEVITSTKEIPVVKDEISLKLKNRLKKLSGISDGK